MERPSHITFDKHQPWSRRAPFLAMAVGLQLTGFWLFTHGLAGHLPTVINPFTYVPIPEKEKLPPPKPRDPDIAKKLPVIDPIIQDFKTALPPDSGGGVKTDPQPRTDGGGPKAPEHVVRAATAIVSTHTVPPYPPIAQRMGEEGKVTLRLTVSAEGRVTKADVLTSSGRNELDQTAQAWILAHWAYKPALEDGVAIASQVVAVVTFSLASQH